MVLTDKTQIYFYKNNTHSKPQNFIEKITLRPAGLFTSLPSLSFVATYQTYLHLCFKFKLHFQNEERDVFTWKNPEPQGPRNNFSYSEEAAKENWVRSEYQIKHNTNKGKRKRKKKNTALARSTPACVTHKASMRENTQGVKIQSKS